MKKLGIALAGGGARGAYQIGAWKALKEFGIDQHITAFSGASVGSLNAVLFAMGDYELAKETWMNLDDKSLFNIEKHIMKRLFKEKLNFFNRGVFSTRKLEKMLHETIDYDIIKDKEIYVATTHIGDDNSTFFDLLRTNYEHYFKKNQRIHYVDLRTIDPETIEKTLLASCAIPIAFRPITIKGKTYYDGGVLDNTPYQPLIDAGCDTIIVIDLYTFSSMRIKKVEEANVYTIFPKRSLRGILDFSHKHIERRFELGYHDMKQKLETIKDELL
ncbi:patatin-like phospholipase family protein [Candidatus Xianfuyuplasma coldseepsis]|uniref:Patatin-like phospholipase family protein n=1 Tax=Candidatus Xianfuyuplasma coldseepsis TaxID=2782163 RepID=A0A7L7KTG4_9MOLU|nr:patatin-like phospholipase family protein [Xianfuyuplasma coldseepsis]QMS85709.1 patatin-like phospholipase family protein [Xianfuyuplasma coldseepsis]